MQPGRTPADSRGVTMTNPIAGREWFQGRIGRTVEESELYHRPAAHPGEGARNCSS